MLYCNNQLCIHQNNGQCTLQEISIDAIGRCVDCLYFNMPSQELVKMKKKWYEQQTAVSCVQPHLQVNFIRGKIKQGKIKRGCALPFTKEEHPSKYD